MSKSADVRNQKVQVKQTIDYSRQTISKLGLSATVGVVFSFSASQAYANSVNVPVTISVVHAVQHVTTLPMTVHSTTTTHTTAAHSSTVSHFNKSSHLTTTSATNATTNLDLSSTHANVSASLLGSFKTLTLDVGGKLDTVSTTSKLTNAEVVAAQQILSGGSQTVLINSKGAADGGTIQLNSALLKSLDTDLGGSLTAINIPKKVIVDDSLSSLTLAGQLTNAGSLVAQNTGTGAAAINAASIVNSGTISGKNIDLTLTAPTITNSGTISSTANATLNTAVLTNTGGTVSAAQAVNLGNNGNFAMNGGTINAPTINLNAGTGTLSVIDSKMVGVVNDIAGNAHINAVGNYTMGTSSVLNDPLFSTTGNFTITSAVTATNGNDLSIVAGGSIFSGANASLDTSSTTGNGGNIMLVAGANYTVDPTTGNLTINQSSLSTGGSSTGGSINLTGTQAGGAPITTINTSSTASGFAGGNVTLVAYSGSTAGSGSVLLPTTSAIQTGVNNPNVVSGNIEVYAGGKSGTTISLGDIQAGGTFGGQIALSTSAPVASAGGVTISGTSGSVINGSFAPSSPAAVQSANLSVGNISNAGGEIILESGGTVTFKTLDASGFGGVAGLGGNSSVSSQNGGNGSNGNEGGNVSINAKGAVTGGSILTYGGGGGGGGGAAQGSDLNPLLTGGQGGAGGAGGAITVNTTIGNISLSGIADASGGGGGGGGAGVGNGTNGFGGSGGGANQISLSTATGSINVAQGIYAVDGANASPATFIKTAASGGGGSYGGGGGGGGGAEIFSNTANTSTGGGGGGGIFGGGGGDAGIANTSTVTSTNGGSGGTGGGGGFPGQGSLSTTPLTTSVQNSGGNGGSNFQSGGSIGAGGLAGTDGNGQGVAGSNVITLGTTSATGSTVTLSSSTGVGTATAPQFALAPTVTVNAPKGSIFVTTGSDTAFTGLQTAATGVVSLSTLGSIATQGNINASTVIITTTPLSNDNGDENILLSGSIQASTAVNLTASGSGLINGGGALIYTPTLTATSGSGSIDLAPGSGNKVTNFQFNTAGSNVEFISAGSLTVKASTDTGADSNIELISYTGSVTFAGTVTSAGSVNVQAGTGIAVNAQITAPESLQLMTNTGTITAPSGITNAGPLSLDVANGSLGALTVNAPNVSVIANAATITDTYSGATTLTQANSDLGFTAGAGNFVFTSAGSSLVVISQAITGFTNVTINDISATGIVSLGNNAITASNAINISTVNGNITSAQPNTLNVVNAANVTLTTKGGNITEFGGGQLTVSAPNLAIAGSGTLTTANISDTVATTLTSATANNLSLQASNIDVSGKVTAPTIAFNSFDSILQTSTTGLISGNSVSLTAEDTIASSLSSSGLALALTGTTPSLNLQAYNATVQSTGAISLGASSVFNNLTVNSGGALSESGTVQVQGQAFLNGPSLTVNGTLNAAILNVITPATGAVTVAAGGVVNSANSTFQTATVNLAAATQSAAGGVLETNTTGATTGSINFINPTGAFSLAGGGTLGASQFLNINSGGNIAIASTLTTNGTINESITAKGTVNLPTGTVRVAQDGQGNGGSIAISGSSVLVGGAAVTPLNALTLIAAGTIGTSENGGSISLTLTGTAAVSLNNSYAFLAESGAASGNGGSISVKTGGALTVNNPSSVFNNSPSAAGGNGGNLSLIAGTNLSIIGSLSANHGSAAGSNFGNITLGSNGSATAPFTVGNGGTPANGISGTISGGNITITNASGIAIDSANAISVNAANTATTPTLILNTNSVSGAGTISNTSALAINSTSNLTLGTLGTAGNSGQSNYGNVSSLTVNAKGNVSVPANLLNLGNENVVSLTSTGTLTLPSSSITVMPAPISLNGGTIFISSLKQNFATSVVAPDGLLLAADGGSGGNAGNVTYISGGTTAINIGGSASSLQIQAGGTTAGGANVTVQNAGAITLGISGLNDTSGLNNNVSLVSTGSTTLVNSDGFNSLHIDQGNLVLESNSATTFAVGGTSPVVNGIDTSNSNLTTGTVTIGNLGGAVQINNTISAANLPATGFAANVFAKTNISSTLAAEAVSGSSISIQSTTGSIGTASSAFLIFGTNNAGAGTRVSLVSGPTGVINVKDNTANGDVLVSSTSGAQYIFNSGGALTTLGNLKETALVDLTAIGALSQATGTSYSTKELDFNLGTMATPVSTNATIIGGVNGSAQVTGGTSTNPIINPTINIIDSTTSALTLGTTGPGVGTQVVAPGGTISIITGGSMLVNGTVGGGFTAAVNTTLVAGPTGTITESSTSTIIGTGSLSLTSASLGTAAAPFKVAASTLSLASPGLINIADNLAFPTPALTGTTVQNIGGTVASFTFTAAGPITLNNITSTGSILVTDTSMAGAGGITTNFGTQLISKTGVITLTSNNTGIGSGSLNLQGNVLAANVNLNAGIGANDNIIMGGSVGTGAGTVLMNATQGDIDSTGTNVTVFAKTFDFASQNIYSGFAFSPSQLQTTASVVNQGGAPLGSVGIYINDQNTAPVTVSALNAAGAGANIDFSTSGNLTTLGAVTAGTTATPGNVTLNAGMSMSLGGNVGMAGTGNSTTISVGNNEVGVPTPVGSTGLTIASGSAVLGANITLNNNFPVGNIGTPATAFVTSATNSLTIEATGAVNVVNNSGSSAITLNVFNSQSLNFTNNSSAGAGLNVGNVSATVNGGGSISISTAGPLTIGQAGAQNTITANGSVTLNATGTGAQGNLTVADGTSIFANNGHLQIANLGNSIAIGNGVTLSSANGVFVGNNGTTGIITIGNNVVAEANTSGDVGMTSANAFTAGDGLNLSTGHGSIVLTATNGAMQIGTGGVANADFTANNGNIQLISIGTGGSITINDSSNLNASGNTVATQIMMNTVGVLNIASGSNQHSTMTSISDANNSTGGISLSGSSVNWGTINGTGNASTNGNVSITATGGSSGTIQDFEGITASGFGSNTGNITIDAGAGSVSVGGSILAQAGVDTFTNNITIRGGSVDVSSNLTTTNTGGTTSGNINITTSGAAGLTIEPSVQLSASTTVGSNSGSINLSSTNGDISVGHDAKIAAAIAVNMTADNGDLTLGAGGASSTNGVFSNGGDITLTVDINHSIELGQGVEVDAFSLTAGQGNVNFNVGPAPVNTFAPVTSGGNVMVEETAQGGSAKTTFAGFNAAGQVYLVLQGANINLGNAGASQNQITFDGGNIIIADPPASATVSPVTVNLPSTLPVFSQLQPQTALSTTDNQAINPSNIGRAMETSNIQNGGTTSSGTNASAALVHGSAISSDSMQIEVGSSSGLTITAHSSTADNNLLQNGLSSSNSLTNVNAANISSDSLPAGISQTNNAVATTDANKILTGGVAAIGKRKSSESYIVRELPEGALLVAPERTTVVPTPYGQVQVASRSLALVVSNKDGMSVYNFDDTGRGAITVSVNGENIALEPGRHITVTHKDVERFELVNPAQYVSYRNVRSRMMNGNAKAYFSEFNHFSAIAGLQPLKNLVNSSDLTKRKIGQHMLKTSALLQLLNRDSTPYEIMAAPSVTAMK